MMQPRSAAFPASEHKNRLARSRAALHEAGLDGCPVVAPENLYYLAGYESWVSVNSPQFMIFTVKDDAPTIVLRNVDLFLAQDTTWLPDLRPYHLHGDSVSALVQQVLEE